MELPKAEAENDAEREQHLDKAVVFGVHRISPQSLGALKPFERRKDAEKRSAPVGERTGRTPRRQVPIRRRLDEEARALERRKRRSFASLGKPTTARASN